MNPRNESPATRWCLNIVGWLFCALFIAGILLIGVIVLKTMGSFRQEETFSSLENRNATDSQALAIAAAIEEHRRKIGTIPVSLYDIVEKGFLTEIPTPPVGEKKWRYQRLATPGEYELSACTSEGYPCIYYNQHECRLVH